MVCQSNRFASQLPHHLSVVPHGKQLDANTDPYVIPEFGADARDVVKLCVVARTFGSIAPLRKVAL